MGEGDIKGAATKVKDEDVLLALLLAQVGLCDLLHLGEDHGGDLLWLELLLAVLCGDLDGGLVVAVDEGKGEELLVALDGGVGPCAANEALCVKDGVLRV